MTPQAVLVGTSSGAVVGAQIASGTPLADLVDRQLGGLAHETSAALGFLDLLRLARAQLFARTPSTRLAASGNSRSPRASTTRPGSAGQPRRDYPTTTGRTRTSASSSSTPSRAPAASSPGTKACPPGRRRRELRHADLRRSGRDRRPPLHGRGMRSTVNLDLAPGTARSSPSRRAPPPSGRGRASADSGPHWARIAGWRSCSGTGPPHEHRGRA
ncbi:hypothetical protein NKG94_32970 [Micromonospora sp. M12]